MQRRTGTTGRGRCRVVRGRGEVYEQIRHGSEREAVAECTGAVESVLLSEWHSGRVVTGRVARNRRKRSATGLQEMRRGSSTSEALGRAWLASNPTSVAGPFYIAYGEVYDAPISTAGLFH